MTYLSVPLIPRRTIFGNPEKANPQISPDGLRMSYLAPLNNVLNVWVGTPGKDYQPVTRDADRGIMHYFWAEDNNHILYIQDVGGNENWRLFAVELASGTVRDLTPFDNVQVQIIAHNKHHPDELLIAMNRESIHLHDVYHLDLRSGEIKMTAKNPGNVAGWVTDSDLRVRAAVGASADGAFDLMLRTDDDSAWKTVLTWSPEDSLTSGPICITRDGKYLYLSDSRDANAARLVRLHLQNNQIEVIAQDPEYDASEWIIDPDTYEIQAVGFVKERDEWIILDESIRADIEAIKKLHHGDFSLLSRDSADETWLVGFTSDNSPVPYFSYNRKTKQSRFLFFNRPELSSYQLASMQPVSFLSRDGLNLHGYLTLPHGVEERNLPLVLNVHGGPWHRDTWGYHPEAQWLANRGYACLQINFRGSTGYGKKFVNAGDREWGGKMHDDLVDAVKWAIQKGIADPAKVAIYGGSYGGYAALVGATFTPELFRCSIAIVGPSNLITFIRTIPEYWSTFLSNMHRRVGNPDTEEEFLKSRSPLFKVDKIKVPMLIAQGANDPRVKQSESEQIVEAMRQKGIPHEYLLFPDEGHGFAKPENRLKFYAAAEKFLALHLGGRFEE